MAELATKTNASQAAHAAMPSTKKVTLTLGASGSTYVAPADGYFYLRGWSEQTIMLQLQYEDATTKDIAIVSREAGHTATVCLPAYEGRKVYAMYENINAYDLTFMFIYANGAE